MNSAPIAACEGGVRLSIRVTPRSSRNAVLGVEADAIKIKLTAPPVEGAANAALIDFVADWLGVRKSAVSILSGDKARHKVVRVGGLTVDQVQAKLR